MSPDGPRGPLRGPDQSPAPCVAGCARPGHHRPGCGDPGCPGCRPRPAEHGLLCTVCHDTLAHALRRLPDAVLDRHTAAAAQAHLVYDAVAGWVRDALELYPAPTARPARLDAVLPATARGTRAAWHRPLGVPDDGHDLADAARTLCGWLDRHLPWVEAQPWSARMAAELGGLVDP